MKYFGAYLHPMLWFIRLFFLFPTYFITNEEIFQFQCSKYIVKHENESILLRELNQKM